ncbi:MULTISPECIES: four-helix bundle copper-binding protein [unclassified Myxococcus]|uniref:four-helix bundle copper-binding protein n=1 Tax=unclassified Myxococcus TaxID=2648731 RepID=UPI001C2CDDCC|nr:MULTISPECIES: four-helix bundle copper-binding protein [unclassified Myxococcus]
MAQVESQKFQMQPFLVGANSQLTDDMRACISNCMSCAAVCLQTMTYCLQKGGKMASADTIRLLEDCVQMCKTSADFMLRTSPLHPQTCAVCAEVCERCAVACERMADDAVMKACAESCRRCVESCRRMAKMS